MNELKSYWGRRVVILPNRMASVGKEGKFGSGASKIAERSWTP